MSRASVSFIKLGFVSLENTVKNSMKTFFFNSGEYTYKKIVREDTLRSVVTF